jgi:hypothetical protein
VVKSRASTSSQARWTRRIDDQQSIWLSVGVHFDSDIAERSKDSGFTTALAREAKRSAKGTAAAVQPESKTHQKARRVVFQGPMVEHAIGG